MPRNDVTGLFTRVSNNFSEPVVGTVIDPVTATSLFDDYDTGLSEALAWHQPLRVVTAAGAVTVSATEAGVALNKTVGAATVVNLPLSELRNGLPITVKDLKGDASTNAITLTATGGELIDGSATLAIVNDRGYVQIFPLVDETGYYSGP